MFHILVADDDKKYEDNKLSTQIQAQTLEQYKDSSTYAKNAKKITFICSIILTS